MINLTVTIGRGVAISFSRKYSYNHSNSGGITHKSVINKFGYGYLICGKWSLCEWEIDQALFESIEYSCYLTGEHKTPWLDNIISINNFAYLNAKKESYKNLYYCAACCKSTKGESRYHCRSCEMKLYHLRKKENELAVAKQLTKKLKEEIKNEIQRVEKIAN